ncbi:MAG: hypothetical protein JWL69_4918 [Phycisphaerales bacterium]|nr:hypothetical protein [Phycisphaerales bacterium]
MSHLSDSGGDSNLPATLNPLSPSLPEDLEEDLTPYEDDPPQVVELRRTQQIAFQALSEGKSVTCAAARANVHRRTVHRWMRDDEDFKAALEACRVGTMDLVRRQLLATAPRAAEKIAEATEKGDGKFALALLKALGAFAGASASGDVPPMDFDKEFDRRQRERMESADPYERAFTEQLESLSNKESLHAGEIMKLGREVFARQQGRDPAAEDA